MKRDELGRRKTSKCLLKEWRTETSLQNSWNSLFGMEEQKQNKKKKTLTKTLFGCFESEHLIDVLALPFWYRCKFWRIVITLFLFHKYRGKIQLDLKRPCFKRMISIYFSEAGTINYFAWKLKCAVLTCFLLHRLLLGSETVIKS